MITKAIKILVGIILPFIVLTIFISPKVRAHIEEKNKAAVPSPVMSSGIPTVQPAEEWVFTWKLPPGHTSIGGNNSLQLKVEITKNSQDSFWAVLHDTDGRGADVSVAGLRLGKIGNDLIGEWTNYLDGDGGKCYLYKTSDGWSGHFEQKNGSRPDCRLEKRK